MTAFAAMHAALFGDRNMGVDASYEPGAGGAAIPCRAILRQPTDVLGFSGTPIAADTMIVEIRKAELPVAAAGDVVVIGPRRVVVQGTPRIDDLGLVWTLDTYPEGA